MSYQVIIKKTGQVYSISDEEGFDLKGKRAEATRPFLVELDDDQYYSNEIAAIKKDKITQADIPTFKPSQQLEMGRKCKAERSIQKAINDVAQKLGGKKATDNPEAVAWSKLISDKDWREMIYQKLRARPNVEWCDDRLHTCACA